MDFPLQTIYFGAPHGTPIYGNPHIRLWNYRGHINFLEAAPHHSSFGSPEGASHTLHPTIGLYIAGKKC